ncbi:MAG: hypothetical protein K8823_1470 [Cenarchaeum symbiont of Oopsacas minuta]|nr:hypothetical protein [Cenarchaeum symbiont of Oopsacas minuta]
MIQQTKNENRELKITINALAAKNIRAKPNKPDSIVKLNMQEPAEKDQFTLITKPRWIKNHVISAETNYPKLCTNTQGLVEDSIPARACNTISRRYCKCCKKQSRQKSILHYQMKDLESD